MTRNILCIVALVLATACSVLAQSLSIPWSRTFDGSNDQDQTVASATDAHGNLYTASWYTRTASEVDWVVCKYDSNGNWKFMKTYDPGTVDKPVAIIVNGANVYVTGVAKVTYNKIYTVKFDTNGTDQSGFPVTYDGGVNAEPVGIAIIGSNVFIGGTLFSSSVNGNANYLALKFSTSGGGVTSLTQNIGGATATQDTAYAMAVDSAAGTMFVVGSTKKSTDIGGAIVKFDGSSTLTFGWQDTTQGVGTTRDVATKVYVSSTHSVYTAISWYDSGGTSSIQLVKYYTGANTKIWRKTTRIQYMNTLRTTSIAMDNSASPRAIYLAGDDWSDFDFNFNELTGSYIAKYDTSAGSSETWWTYDGNGQTNGLVVDGSGNVWTGGTDGWSFCITEYTSAGSLGSFLFYDNEPGPPGFGSNAYSFGMSYDGSGNIYLCGSQSNSIVEAVGSDFSPYLNAFVVKFSGLSGLHSMAQRSPLSEQTPTEFKLEQNYPNPFNPTTNISYVVPKGDNVTLKVYDILGKEVQTLVDNQYIEAGAHQVSFNAANVSSGTYFYRLVSNNGKFAAVKKMMVIK